MLGNGEVESVIFRKLGDDVNQLFAVVSAELNEIVIALIKNAVSSAMPIYILVWARNTYVS